MSDSTAQPLRPRAALRAQDAANFLGLSVSTLAKWRTHGNDAGPRFRRLTARIIVYEITELERWLADRQNCSSTSEYPHYKPLGRPRRTAQS